MAIEAHVQRTKFPKCSACGKQIDIEQFKKWDLLEEVSFALFLLKDVRERYQAMIDEHKRTD